MIHDRNLAIHIFLIKLDVQKYSYANNNKQLLEIQAFDSLKIDCNLLWKFKQIIESNKKD